MSYELITPQYSPDTVTAITLRHFEKQSKEQAEHEYDVEHGLLPPPPPDDDPTIAPSVRSIHKKKRKVRSAIVSRRKTAIYVQKLEEELETRESLNDKLRHRLKTYRQSLHAISAQVDSLEPNSTPRRERRPIDPPSFSSSLPSSSSAPAAVSAALPPSMRFPPAAMAPPAPPAPPSFEPRFPSFGPAIDASDISSALGLGYAEAPTQQATPLAPLAVPPPPQPPMSQAMAPSPASALSSVFQRVPQQSVQPQHHHSQPTNQDLPDFFPEQQALVNDMLNAALVAPTAKALDSADFSECSDRNISPSIRPSAAPSPPELANLPPVVNPIEQAAAAFVATRDAHSWRQASIREPFVM